MTDDRRNDGHTAVDTPDEGFNAGEAENDTERSGEGMESLLDSLEQDYRSPRRGEVVEGTIVSIDKDGILVDIGTKSEGLVPSHEAQAALQEFGDELRVGEPILVYVVQPEDREGHVILSVRRARSERVWRQVQKQHEEGAIIEAEVVDHNKGGLIVDVSGLRGFVPSSQIVGFRQPSSNGDEGDERFASMVGRKLQLKVLEINRRRNRLILSERAAMQEIRQRRKEELLSELEPGQIRHGRVSSICDFGAFVDIGGADGLVHISELSWSPTSHPSEVVQPDQEVDVQVLAVDHEKKKIALSLRRAKPEPWSTVGERYAPGDEVKGTITKIASFGAFARVEDGVEGLIHISELADGHVAHPKNVVKEGDVVTLKVIRVEPERRRLGLSLKQAEGNEPVEDAAEETQDVAEAEKVEPADVVESRESDSAEQPADSNDEQPVEQA